MLEDDDAFAELLIMCVGARPGHRLARRADSGAEAEAIVREGGVDAILADDSPPDGTGTALAGKLRTLAPPPPVPVATADIDEHLIGDAVQAGA